MRKILFSLIAFAALTFDAGAQWMRPAREVRAETNGWTYIPTSKTNVQLVINWLDEELGRVSITGGFTVLPDTNNLQVLMDWIDDNWNTNAVPTLTFLADSYMKGTNIIGATYNASTKTWSIPASGVQVSTSSWEVLNPADTNAQAAFDAIDTWAGYVNSNLNVASVAGAAKLAYNNGYGTAAAVPTSSVPASTMVTWTNGLHEASSGNTNVLRWGTGSDVGKLIIKTPGTYFYYVAWAVKKLDTPNVYGYAYHYNSANVLKTASVISGAFSESTNVASDGVGVLVAVDANVDDYIIAYANTSGSDTNLIALGAQYIFAYKVYNSD